MGLFKVKATAEAVKESGGGRFIGESGIYDVTIKFASLDVSKGGAESVNFNLDYNGNSQTIYGPYVTNKKGEPLDIGLKVVNNLLVIAGLEDGQEPDVEEEEHAVGKDNKLQTFSVITDLSDLEVKIRLQKEYSLYRDEIKERMVIKGFYRADSASAGEVISGEAIGTQLEKDQAYASNITYRDDLTEDDITAWRANKSDGASGGTPAPKKTPAKKPGSLFKK